MGITQLLTRETDMNTEYATPALFAALAAAQGEVENASKSSSNPHFKSKYADLAEVLNTVRPVFARHGLSILQSTGFNGATVNVTTLIAHADGGHVSSTAACVPAKTDAQGIGACTTYLRRYSLAAMAGVAQEDDDGTTAAHNGKPAPIAAKVTPLDGAWEAMSEESQQWLLGIAANIRDHFAGEKPTDDEADKAHAYMLSQNLDADEKMALWTQLHSSIRSALKRANDRANKKDAA